MGCLRLVFLADCHIINLAAFYSYVREEFIPLPDSIWNIVNKDSPWHHPPTPTPTMECTCFLQWVIRWKDSSHNKNNMRIKTHSLHLVATNAEIISQNIMLITAGLHTGSAKLKKYRWQFSLDDCTKFLEISFEMNRLLFHHYCKRPETLYFMNIVFLDFLKALCF